LEFNIECGGGVYGANRHHLSPKNHHPDPECKVTHSFRNSQIFMQFLYVSRVLIKVNLDNGLRNNKISVSGKKYEVKVPKKYNFHLINIRPLYL
jgi:hypothetical protein